MIQKNLQTEGTFDYCGFSKYGPSPDLYLNDNDVREPPRSSI